MKKNRLALVFITATLISSLFSVSSCTKGETNDTKITRELITGDFSFEIPALAKNGPQDSITFFNFETNMDSIVKSFSAKYDTSSIRSVQLKSCVLTIVNEDDNNNFGNFHTMNIGITSGSNPFITRMASSTDIPDTSAYFLNVTKSYQHNLVAYYKADSMRYLVYGNLRRPTTVPLNCNAKITIDMTLSK